MFEGPDICVRPVSRGLALGVNVITRQTTPFFSSTL